LVHVEDVSRAFVALLEVPRRVVHAQAFNVGRQGENYQIRDVGAIVEAGARGSRVAYASGASPDTRNYRVDFSKLEREVPGFRPTWTVAQGVAELLEAYRRTRLDRERFLGPRYYRIQTVKARQAARELDADLRGV